MVRKLKLDEIRNDLVAVEGILSSRSRETDPIGYAQFSTRKKQLEEQIGTLSGMPDNKASVALMFAGAPVTGSRGIKAEFAGKAVDIFQELVAKQFANNELGSIAARGPVPLRANSDLLITHIARGSVGLILEEADQNDSLTQSQLSVAVDKVTQDIAQITEVNSEGFEELITEIDNRYFSSLGSLFRLLDDSGATIRLVEGDRDIQLDSLAIHRGRERTASAMIEDKDNVRLLGHLYLLPAHRKFELVLPGSGEIIYGNVSGEFAKRHLDAVTNMADVIGQEWQVRLRSRTISRPSREPQITYTLLGLLERVQRPPELR